MQEDADAVLEEEEKKPEVDADDAPPKLNPVTPPQEAIKEPEADKETVTAIDVSSYWIGRHLHLYYKCLFKLCARK